MTLATADGHFGHRRSTLFTAAASGLVGLAVGAGAVVAAPLVADRFSRPEQVAVVDSAHSLANDPGGSVYGQQVPHSAAPAPASLAAAPGGSVYDEQVPD